MPSHCVCNEFSYVGKLSQIIFDELPTHRNILLPHTQLLDVCQNKNKNNKSLDYQSTRENRASCLRNVQVLTLLFVYIVTPSHLFSWNSPFYSEPVDVWFLFVSAQLFFLVQKMDRAIFSRNFNSRQVRRMATYSILELRQPLFFLCCCILSVKTKGFKTSRLSCFI